MNDTPAALNTLLTHFKDTGRKPSDYDAIFTGDLGHIGKEILAELSKLKGYNIKSNYNDCGVLIFDKDKQDTHMGGSRLRLYAELFFLVCYLMNLRKILLLMI